jgi:hypothetical protein
MKSRVSTAIGGMLFGIACAVFAGCSRNPPSKPLPVLDALQTYALTDGHCVSLKKLPAGWRSELHPVQNKIAITFEKPIYLEEWLKRDGGLGPDSWDALVGAVIVPDKDYYLHFTEDVRNLALEGRYARWAERDGHVFKAYHHTDGQDALLLSHDNSIALICRPSNPPYRLHGMCYGIAPSPVSSMVLSVAFPQDNFDQPDRLDGDITHAIDEIAVAAKAALVPCPANIVVPTISQAERDEFRRKMENR